MINLAVIGISNFGAAHIDAAQRVADAGLARFTAVADIRLAELQETADALRARGVACYDNHRAMLDAHPELDLVTLPLPIHLHEPMTVELLERGLNVLVEKPPAPTPAEARSMAEAAKRTGKLLGVGFQMSASPLLAAMRELVGSGRLGELQSLSVLCLGKRYDNYYARAPWSGRIELNGKIVRDGTLNNPFAHPAQLMLSVAWAAAKTAIRPVQVEAELFAGHDIETEDTCALRARLNTGVSLNFYASVCTHEGFSQQFEVVGSKGTITWSGQSTPEAVVRFADGTEETLPNLYPDTARITEMMFRNYIDVLEGRAARLLCPIEDTLAFVELVDGFFAHPVKHLCGTPYVNRVALVDGGRDEVATYLEGIEEFARAAYASGKLYSEVGAPWAQ